MHKAKLAAVLFDLDGTLLDTAPDIAAALNSALAAHRLPALSEAQVSAFVGRGPRMLVERALAAQGSDVARLADAVLERYLHCYERQLATYARPLPGAADCLRELSRRGLRLAVVTNALQRFAEPLLQWAGLAHYLQLVVGGDRVREGKPHPAALRLACAGLGALPAETLMVGDSITDVQAARAAACEVVCVTNGYVGAHPLRPQDCSLIDSLALLPAWIDRHQRGEHATGDIQS